MNNIWLAFITGITTGGVSCLAVQGGLLTSAISRDKLKSKNKWKEIAIFLIGKLFAYTILGILLGLVGSLLVFTPRIQAIIQLLIGFFLLGTAGRLANIHPIFRYFAIQPPKSLFRFARKGSNLESSFTPLITGFSTILIPCGVTQAMMLIAVASGSAISGALIMFAFVLGTSPIFFILGMAAAEMLKKKAFTYIASFAVLVFGIISLNSAMVLLGSNHTSQNYWKVLTLNNIQTENSAKGIKINNGVQEATIYVKNNGYESDTTTLKAGVPVKLRLITENTVSCSRAFTIPSLGVRKILQTTGEEIIEFIPQQTGRLNYSCSMGMYSGSFNVVK